MGFGAVVAVGLGIVLVPQESRGASGPALGPIHQAYHAVLVPKSYPWKRLGPPANQPTLYSGSPLEVRAVPIGHTAAEPTIGVNLAGTAFYPAVAYDAAQGILPRTHVFRSRDGGLTWTEITPMIGGADRPAGVLRSVSNQNACVEDGGKGSPGPLVPGRGVAVRQRSGPSLWAPSHATA